MIPTECPVCHAKPAPAGNTYYCPSCGWNRDAALASLRMSQNSTPIAILLFGGVAAFMYWGMRFNRAPMLMLFWCVPVLGIAINYFYMKRTIAKLQAAPASKQAQAIPANFAVREAAPGAVATNFGFAMGAMGAESPGMTTFPPSAKDAVLLHSAAPRQVRISKSGRITLWVVALGLSLFVIPLAAGAYRQWEQYHSFSNVTGLGWGIAIEIVVALAAIGIWRGQVRECDLLEHGDVVAGRVLRQWTDKGNSNVEYEFTDFLGQSHRGWCQDRTDKLVAGMAVPVFYDRSNPKRQIASCSTLHEVTV